jgi:hypothetical protein
MSSPVEIWSRSGAADWRDALTSKILAGELGRRLDPLQPELRCVEPAGAGQVGTRRIQAGSEPGSRAHRIFCGEGVAVAAELADVTALDRILIASGGGQESRRPFDTWVGVRMPERLQEPGAGHLARALADVSAVAVCDAASLETLEALGIIGDVDVLPPLTTLAGETITREAALTEANKLRSSGSLPSSQYVLIEDDPQVALGDAMQAIPPGSSVVMLPAPPGIESSLPEKLVRVGCEVTKLAVPATEAVVAAVAAARSVVASSPSLAGLATSYGVATPGRTPTWMNRTAVDLERRIDQLALGLRDPAQPASQLATLRRRFDLLRERLVASDRAAGDRAHELERASAGQLRELASVAQQLAMKLSEHERSAESTSGRPDSAHPVEDPAAVAQLRAERDAFEQQLLATLGSRSWRYLAPLRRVAAAGRAVYRR